MSSAEIGTVIILPCDDNIQQNETATPNQNLDQQQMNTNIL
jgi:hypothetical protein